MLQTPQDIDGKALLLGAAAGVATLSTLQLAWYVYSRRPTLQQNKASPARSAEHHPLQNGFTEPLQEAYAPGSAAEAAAAAEFDAPDQEWRLLRRAEAVLSRRTDQLLVVADGCTAAGLQALCRTCECFGIQHVWVVSSLSEHRRDAIWSPGSASRPSPFQTPEKATPPPALPNVASSAPAAGQGPEQWLSMRSFASATDCVAALREDGRQIWATDLSQQAEVLSLPLQGGLPPRLAVVFGPDSGGCSDDFLEAADRRLHLPLHGFTPSLNVAVAAGVIVHMLLSEAAESTHRHLPTEAAQDLREAWYEQLARGDEDVYEAHLLQLRSPPPPFSDLRLHASQRPPRLSKKVRQRREVMMRQFSGGRPPAAWGSAGLGPGFAGYAASPRRTSSVSSPSTPSRSLNYDSSFA